jgi:2-keto-3-deoxy-L-rhamnonate aldolase RhmA
MHNTLKAKLADGKTTVGTWMTIFHPALAEYLSTLPFDWFVFDQEHSPLDVDTTQTLLQAMHGSRVTPLIRVAWNDQVRIKKALDIGPHGLVIPMVSTAEDAENAVRYCKYPPEGVRGCGPARALMVDTDYLETANDEIMVIVQIETEEAVANVESILSTEGIDAFFLGPMDLSYSLGLRGDTGDARLQTAIDTVMRAGKALGVPGGIWQGAGKSVSERIEEGWQMVALGFDAQYMLAGGKQALREAGISE